MPLALLIIDIFLRLLIVENSTSSMIPLIRSGKNLMTLRGWAMSVTSAWWTITVIASSTKIEWEISFHSWLLASPVPYHHRNGSRHLLHPLGFRDGTCATMWICPKANDQKSDLTSIYHADLPVVFNQFWLSLSRPFCPQSPQHPNQQIRSKLESPTDYRHRAHARYMPTRLIALCRDKYFLL